MSRICPDAMFDLAHDGLNAFLMAYPNMDEEQRDKIRKLIEHFGKPEFSYEVERRPALLCHAGPDGSIFISPNTLVASESTPRLRRSLEKRP